jgi:hypothetical protein
MNSQEPYRLSNIDLSNIVYTNVKQTDKKKVILIKYRDNKLRNLVFQTPTLLSINEPKLFLKDNIGYGEIEVALYNNDNNKIKKLLTFFNDLSNKIINDAKENDEWFNKTTPMNFQKIVRDSDTFKNGLIKLKLLRNSNFETIIQKNNKQKIKMEMLGENTLIKMLLEVYAVWVNSNNDFGVFLRPVLVSCNKDSYNYKFIPDSDDEVDDDDDIPDTEINNLFLKQNDKDYSETTSQLEYDSSTTSDFEGDENLDNSCVTSDINNLSISEIKNNNKELIDDIKLNIVDEASDKEDDIDKILN